MSLKHIQVEPEFLGIFFSLFLGRNLSPNDQKRHNEHVENYNKHLTTTKNQNKSIKNV